MRARTAALVSVTAASAMLTMTQAGASPTEKAETPAQWCTSQGGEPATYVPWVGQQGQALPLGGERAFCRWVAKDKSEMVIAADTLSAGKPTLAALAYVNKPKPQGGGTGQPAHDYCTQLGGTWKYSDKPDVGGWAEKGAGNKNLHDPCMFADGSAISAWGLLYHTNGIIRGADLTKKFKADIPN
ncbi:hypothetical protein [Streptomyces sp. NPDC048644]|uniref:hypothetical protein n=1 Tax=Streptomyces sp. NPDC048644 TaxID=3365582 RepID=UPI00371CACC0